MILGLKALVEKHYWSEDYPVPYGELAATRGFNQSKDRLESFYDNFLNVARKAKGAIECAQELSLKG
mgnify:CR=1 FL=1